MKKHLLSCSILRNIAAFLLVFLAAAMARLPGELPGEEINEEQYFEHVVPRDSIEARVPETSPLSPVWIDKVSKTWDAPSLSLQLGQDDEMLQLGMGAVFVPRMTSAESEPDVEILDPTGKEIVRGKPGRKYNMVSGTYYVMLGSGMHKQRIVKKVDVQDGKVIPLLPDWAAMTINVVNENNVPFHGEYELARIDDFEAYGRSYGADPDLGEGLKTWILRPGLYKIFGVGQGYNTMQNFITVRLIPGEYSQIVLVEEEKEKIIMGGGIIPVGQERNPDSRWKYGVDIGGTIVLNTSHERQGDDSTNTNVNLELSSRFWLNYHRERIEWDTRLFFNEGVLYNREETRLSSTPDEIRLMSLFTWRLLQWFGPYGRFEVFTGVIPQYARTEGTDNNYCFVILNKDSSLAEIDSLSSSRLTEPAFSPLLAEAGVGANMRLLSNRFAEARFLLGIGFTQESRYRETEEDVPDSVVKYDTGSVSGKTFAGIDSADDHINIRYIGTTTTQPEYGPEATFYATLRFGRFGTNETEFKIKAPVVRFSKPGFKPDVQWRNTLSWNLIKSVTLDYQVQYALRWPSEENLRTDMWTHRILLRFSFSSR